MKNYTKKPVTIQAVQYTGNIDEIIEFTGRENLAYHDAIGWVIKTLEGDHFISMNDYIIKGVKGEFYPCKEDIFHMTYDSNPEPSTEPAKTLSNTTASQAKDNVKDIQFWGNGDTFKLISKAHSKNEGWMKSTKAMEIAGVGCVVQVTTQQGDNVAEAITFVPGVKIEETVQESNREVVSRKLVKIL